MRLVLVAAVAHDRVIGRNGALPWRLPDDLRHFKQRTLGRPVVMGRKTWASIGRALPGRLNLVVTRQAGYHAPGAEVVHDVEQALARAARDGANEACVIGGGEIYAATLARADELVLTHVDADVPGDARFPAFDASEWEVADERAHPADERHAYPFRIVVYRRR
jgi:dihydrofolate reductase